MDFFDFFKMGMEELCLKKHHGSSRVYHHNKIKK